MSNEITIPDEIISNKIYFIRNQKVMLDRDLAELYGVETRVLKQAVRRNEKRFPEDFMFEMTKQELEIWRSQFVTSNQDKKGLRYAPFCFTEQGVTMLSCILNSERAIIVNIKIIRVFTKLRTILTDNLSVKLDIEQIKKKLTNHSKNIELVFDYLDELTEKKENSIPRKQIGFKK
ncbi:MAG: ORF6N domain-containing protein [Flavobacteriaceae bacterium]|nr:MAG: ORF6N domain-containing protein [Flavobacteriaceae bacterium]